LTKGSRRWMLDFAQPKRRSASAGDARRPRATTVASFHFMARFSIWLFPGWFRVDSELTRLKKRSCKRSSLLPDTRRQPSHQSENSSCTVFSVYIQNSVLGHSMARQSQCQAADATPCPPDYNCRCLLQDRYHPVINPVLGTWGIRDTRASYGRPSTAEWLWLWLNKDRSQFRVAHGQ
jgi:hypothetical protein